MAGLIFLAALVIALCLCFWLSKTIGNLIPNATLRSIVQVGLFVALLAAPFVDELIGKRQFEALCKANGIESADVSRARGRRVKLEVGESQPIKGTIVPGTVTDMFYKSADNNEILIQHKQYGADGGWLMRYTPLSMGSHHPMLFSSCGFEYDIKKSIFAKNNITQIN